MNVYGYEIADEVVTEIGRFTVLWNLFEDNFLSGASNLWQACSRIHDYDHTRGGDLRDFMTAQCHRYDNYDDFIDEFVYTSRADYRATDNQRRVIIAFIEDDRSFSEQDRFYGCMLLIRRFRNNLMHGIKAPQCLSDQLAVFRDINAILESLS